MLEVSGYIRGSFTSYEQNLIIFLSYALSISDADLEEDVSNFASV